MHDDYVIAKQACLIHHSKTSDLKTGKHIDIFGSYEYSILLSIFSPTVVQEGCDMYSLLF